MEKWEEYKFRIEAYTPDTLPMARLADYLNELATILGETPYVHFVRLDPGSNVIVHKIDIEAVPRVRANAVAVKKGEGTVVQMRAYRRVNSMLREDNGKGVLAEKDNVEIIPFPGIDEEKLKLTSIRQHGKIDGEVIRVGGSKEIVPILLEVEGREISGCHAKRAIAKELAKNLFEPVRLYGEGRWDRNDDGEWNLASFAVDRFDVLPESTFSKTVIALRALRGEWGKDALYELLESRHSKEDAQ